MALPENILLDSPAPGHYVLSGHLPSAVQDSETGVRVVPPKFTYIPPELPTAALEFVIAERKKAEKSAKKKTPKTQPEPTEPEETEPLV